MMMDDCISVYDNENDDAMCSDNSTASGYEKQIDDGKHDERY